MSADDIFGPETDDEKAEAEGHPLMVMLDKANDPVQLLLDYLNQRFAGG